MGESFVSHLVNITMGSKLFHPYKLKDIRPVRLVLPVWSSIGRGHSLSVRLYITCNSAVHLNVDNVRIPKIWYGCVCTGLLRLWKSIHLTIILSLVLLSSISSSVLPNGVHNEESQRISPPPHHVGLQEHYLGWCGVAIKSSLIAFRCLVCLLVECVDRVLAQFLCTVFCICVGMSDLNAFVEHL